MDTALLNLDVNPEVCARIVAAADELFLETGKLGVPNVDAVRRKAHVNMNDASKVMRAWRKAQTATAAPVPGAIPDRVIEASSSLLKVLWAEATDHANRALQAAQGSWENERNEADAIRMQLAVAFDEQGSELKALQVALSDSEREINQQRQCAAGALGKVTELASRVEVAQAEAMAAATISRNLSKHIDDLRGEIAHAHAQIDSIQRENAHHAELTSLDLAKARSEHALALELAARVCEENTALKTQLSLVGEQNQVYLQMIAQRETPKPRARSKTQQ